MFPANQSASFFSTSLIEEREPFDFLNLYIPANPFHSLANNIVPAVVLFSIVLGLALTAVPEKATLLDVLDVARKAVSKATSFVVASTPYGMFAIGAVVAGTLSLDDLERLQVYLITYAGISLLLSLWVLPGLIATLTPIPYRAVLSRTRDALVMAFMTTSLFAVLPLLAEEAKSLVREYSGTDTRDKSAAEVIVAASFNFPHAGKLLTLSFVLFAGWFTDTRIPITDYPRLAGAGLLTMFGSANSAVPFLLDMLHVPADTFQLFVTSGIVNARFGTLLAAVHTLAIAILGSCAVSGAMTFSGPKLMRFLAITAVLTASVVGGTRLLLSSVLHRPYAKDALLASMASRHHWEVAHVYTRKDEAPAMPPVVTSVLDRAMGRHALRVGYFEDSLPYAFFNNRRELVGFDVDMAHQLARDLGLALELVPVDRAALETNLDPSDCDLVMSGAIITTDRSMHVLYSSPYLDETAAFVVPDHLAATFSEWSSIHAMGPLRLALPRGSSYYMRKLRDELKDAEIIEVDSLDRMFGPNAPKVDALVSTAERGSAYTLLHPEYSVAVPKPRPIKVPLAYIIAGRDAPLAATVNTWIELKRKDSTIDELFDHWIRGLDAVPTRPRWSIARNVLHWLR